MILSEKIMSNVAKNFDILATGLSVLHNYFNKITFPICIQLKLYIFFQQNRSFRVQIFWKF